MFSTVGNHTLTATITDNEGKTKTVTTQHSCFYPNIEDAFSVTYDPDYTFANYDRAPRDLPTASMNSGFYPSGKTYQVTSTYWTRMADNYTTRYISDVTITDGWGRSKTIRVTTDNYNKQ